jgi:HD superfamily phosphohydrolase
MLKKNDINLEQWGLTEQDETFIKEIVAGTKEEKRQGRGRDKFWMYDIVNNSRSGLDVDKLDYFMRDMRYANVQMGTNDFTRFIELGRVLPAQPLGRSVVGLNKEDLPSMICYPLKMYEETLGLFQVRFKMHRTVYTHKTVKEIEYMITDALQLADEFVNIQGTKSPQFPDGMYKMSETIYDMEAFSKLKDTILDHIMLLPADEDDASQSKLLRAQELITRVRQRDLYRCVGKVIRYYSSTHARACQIGHNSDKTDFRPAGRNTDTNSHPRLHPRPNPNPTRIEGALPQGCQGVQDEGANHSGSDPRGESGRR